MPTVRPTPQSRIGTKHTEPKNTRLSIAFFLIVPTPSNISLLKIPVHRYDPNQQAFVDVKWHELEVGDFVQVRNRTTLPADVVTVSVAEKSEPATGVCYVETKSLDGETNLKIRNACASTYSKVRLCMLYEARRWPV